MPQEFTIRAVNDWRGEMRTDLSRALRVSMDVWNRDGEQATKHMLIVMAQSARASTPQAKKRRKVLRDERGQYVEIYRNGEARKTYRWMFEGSSPMRRGTWEGVRNIPSRGLAKRSWMWGLSRVGGKGDKRKPIAGTSVVAQLRRGRRAVGWQKTNRLGYIDDIMPSGYQRIAESKAVNKVMKQAETRMVRAYERKVGRR